MLMDILKVVVGLIAGLVIGFFAAKFYMQKYLLMSDIKINMIKDSKEKIIKFSNQINKLIMFI